MQQDYFQMRALELAPQVFATGQLFERDLKLVAKEGVRSIVNAQSDGELTGKASSADLAKVADDLGMTYVHFPVEPKSITKQELEAFAKICEELERPLLISSGSGGRSARVWEMAE